MIIIMSYRLLFGNIYEKLDENKKPLLKIIAAEKELLNDPLVAGVALGVRWQVEKLLMGTYKGEVHEQIQLIVFKDNLNRYLKSEMTDQHLLDGSSIVLLHESRGNRNPAGQGR